MSMKNWGYLKMYCLCISSLWSLDHVHASWLSLSLALTKNGSNLQRACYLWEIWNEQFGCLTSLIASLQSLSSNKRNLENKYQSLRPKIGELHLKLEPKKVHHYYTNRLDLWHRVGPALKDHIEVSYLLFVKVRKRTWLPTNSYKRVKCNLDVVRTACNNI